MSDVFWLQIKTNKPRNTRLLQVSDQSDAAVCARLKAEGGAQEGSVLEVAAVLIRRQKPPETKCFTTDQLLSGTDCDTSGQVVVSGIHQRPEPSMFNPIRLFHWVRFLVDVHDSSSLVFCRTFQCMSCWRVLEMHAGQVFVNTGTSVRLGSNLLHGLDWGCLMNTWNETDLLTSLTWWSSRSSTSGKQSAGFQPCGGSVLFWWREPNHFSAFKSKIRGLHLL